MTAFFRVLARLLPSRVRARHLPALVRTFEARLAEARRASGRLAAMAVACREYGEVAGRAG